MKKESNINLFTQPTEVFRELIQRAIKNQHISIQEETEFYLVSLLSQYMDTQAMKKSEEDPLAITFHKALLSQNTDRIKILKDLGDFSLFIAGIFSDSLKRKVIDIDYYMAMGGTAYKNLSIVIPQEQLQEFFSDLCKRFSIYVDLLGEVSDKAFTHSNEDILRLYERWLKTKSTRLAQLLKKEGLIPIEVLYKN